MAASLIIATFSNVIAGVTGLILVPNNGILLGINFVSTLMVVGILLSKTND